MMLWRDYAPAILDDYDVVVTSGNEPQWWMPREWQTWIAYTHSTPRWLYDRYNEIDGWTGRTASQVKLIIPSEQSFRQGQAHRTERSPLKRDHEEIQEQLEALHDD
jgi:hypothetical protein